jgi:hypothetical protein
MQKRSDKWKSKPKGWTDKSRKQFWESLTGESEHKVTVCMEKMKGKVDNTGAFCASLADRVLGTTKWRGKKAKAAVMPKRQTTQFTCVATSISMCLEAQGIPATEAEVNRTLGATAKRGASWEQALACLSHFGMRGTLVIPSTLAQVKAWTDAGTPVIIGWNPEGRPWSHASVVFDVSEDWTVSIADPNCPDPDQCVRTLSKAEFYQKWYEPYNDFLVRRPALAVEREVSDEGRQTMASAKFSSYSKLNAALRGER